MLYPQRLPTVWFLPLLTGLCLGLPQPAIAQTTPSITAAPDGTGTVVNHNGQTYTINGGTQAGANLFHSFEQFGLQPSEIADFLSNPAIQNVVGRVVGGDPSVIEGLIRLSGGNSNLFLVNPAGWVFTQGAALDVPGSFGVTTANRIGFGSAFFNAIGSNDYTKLTGAPTDLIFDSTQPGAIINGADLQVEHGSLWLVGGSMISTGNITAPNGTVTLAAVPGQSQVKLSHSGMVLDLVLDAIPANKLQPDTPLGLAATDLPRYLTGGNITSATGLAQAADGSLWLVGSNLHVDGSGNTIVGETVTAENVNLLAAERVTPSDPGLISGDVTVVRYPAAGDAVILSAIDSRADNPEALLYGGAAGTIAQIIDRDEDGISVISEQLSMLSAAGGQVAAVSITAEGHEGNFWLGNTWITHETVQDYRDQFSAWRDVLTEQADLLLYSCFTALGTTGEALVQTLAELTGADVAASVNATGSANYGGDWQLEQRTGLIEAETPFTEATLEAWDGKLATLTVTDFGDSGAGTLRQRIENDAVAGDMITLASAGTVNLSGEIAIATNNLTIDGNGGIVDGGKNGRIFNIMATATTSTIQNLTIRNGSAIDNGGGINMANGTTLTLHSAIVSRNTAGNRGGGIHLGTNGSLSVTNSQITDNIAVTITGGGIRLGSGGTLTMSQTTIARNTAGNGGASDRGGGIYVGSNGNATLDQVIITNNRVNGGDGGGIAFNINNTFTLSNSTVSGNSAGDKGGGIYFNNNGTLTVNNSTISGNSAGDHGGGIYLDDNAVVQATNSTIAFNTTAAQGGGIYIDSLTGSGIVNNTIIANNHANTAGPDLSGTFTANHSLILNTNGATLSGSNNIFGQDPLLQPLAFNAGSPTPTHALDFRSPAINGGSNALALAAGLTTDQSTIFTRIFGGTVDIGAYEVNPDYQTNPFTFAELYLDPLVEVVLGVAVCQTIPEVERGSGLDVVEFEEAEGNGSSDRDQNCLPVQANKVRVSGF